MKITLDEVERAYKLLKNYSYYDKINQFLRIKIAEFETNQNINEVFVSIERLINNLNIDDTDMYIDLLDQISFNFIPKSVSCPKRKKSGEEDKESRFITNKNTHDKYCLKGVNYYIDAPIEIHIIAALWVIRVGRLLDEELSDSVYGHRLRKEKNSSSSLFRFFATQYNNWRDNAMDRALDILENHEKNVAIFSMDIKQYYYHIDFSFDDLLKKLEESEYPQEEWLTLTSLLTGIHRKYAEVLHNPLLQTHANIFTEGDKEKLFLPIGLMSSEVLSNWYLREFDRKILDDVNPAYYGRYVDDILIVIQNPDIYPEENKKANEIQEDEISHFIGKYFKGILELDGKDNYEILEPEGLQIQKSKLILQYFDKDHSRAGLTAFKKEIDRISSAFRFLPDEEIDSSLEDVAYYLLYEGSPNRFRSVIGIRENSNELSRYLSSQIIAHRLCEFTPDEKVMDQIERFFKGNNGLEFFRLWEKVFTLAIINKKFFWAYKFYKKLLKTIGQLTRLELTDKNTNDENESEQQEKDESILSQVRENLEQYLRISLAIPCGLLGLKLPKEEIREKVGAKLSELIYENDTILDYAVCLRMSNMIGHDVVAFPLINYTKFDGDLTDRNLLKEMPHTKLVDFKIKYSPRFIHLDEQQLFEFQETLNGKRRKFDEQLFECFNKAVDKYEERFSNTLNSDGKIEPLPRLSDPEKSKGVNVRNLHIKSDKKRSKIKVAIANIRIERKDIEASFRKDRKPNVSKNRQARIFEILNAVENEFKVGNNNGKNNHKVDLLVFPEFSIPHDWLPFMISYARRHQIGIVFGMEHWVVGETALNFLVTVLPFKHGNYNNAVVTFRVKNHYAPRERAELEKVHLKTGEPLDPKNATYVKFCWRGASFAPYNCFELADIDHRSLFKSELDFLVASVWNPDTNFYEHILQSAIRDLHCYLIQANTSQYGGSCVLQPTKTEKTKIIHVKGGENSCILTATLDIANIRDFQFQNYSTTEKRFKPTPPGYDPQKVLTRCKDK